MKTVLRIAPHSVIPGAQVIEIWYRGELIGQVAGADGPGVRIVSKYGLKASIQGSDGPPAHVSVHPDSILAVIEVQVIK